MSFLRSVVCLFVSVVALGVGCSSDSSDDGDGDGGDCPTGSEGCPCYGNMSCDGDLTCASEHCVDLGGTGGSGATGGTGAGGSSGAGGSAVGGNAGNATGGSAGTSGGGSGTSGGGSGGSGQSGSGGMSGTSGSGGGACGDTSSDWQNCGACGRTCDNGGERCPANVCCTAGTCTPFFGPCFEENDGFTSCDQACASVGETCVPRGCGGTTASNGTTWYGWGIGSGDRCESLGPISDEGQACDEAFTWELNESYKRCCCTDTR